MVCISRIFADNCAKGAFFRGATEDNGARNDKNSGRLARRRLTGSEFQNVLELVRDGTSPDEKLLVVDLLRRSITITRLVTDDIFLDVDDYESIPLRVSSKRSRDDAERSLRMRIKFITIYRSIELFC